jgi:hypothetical protein
MHRVEHSALDCPGSSEAMQADGLQGESGCRLFRFAHGLGGFGFPLPGQQVSNLLLADHRLNWDHHHFFDCADGLRSCRRDSTIHGLVVSG